MNKYQITDVLTHRDPMILIDSLEQYDEISCTCHVSINENSPFYDNDKLGVPSYIGTEYMAQSIAAFAGAHALDNNSKVNIGFLLGSRKYTTEQAYFKLRSQLIINIEQLYKEDSGLCVYDCTISEMDNKTIAHAKISVFQPLNPEAFLKECYE